jgi:hypothetical protein
VEVVDLTSVVLIYKVLTAQICEMMMPLLDPGERAGISCTNYKKLQRQIPLFEKCAICHMTYMTLKFVDTAAVRCNWLFQSGTYLSQNFSNDS